jgi:hypothetical protein
MKKLLLSTVVAAAMSSGAMAGEPLTTAQLDQVTAGQININLTLQHALAAAYSQGGCNVAICRSKGGRSGGSGNSVAAAEALNANATTQNNVRLFAF